MYEQEMLVSELVYSFLIPEVHKQEFRRKGKLASRGVTWSKKWGTVSGAREGGNGDGYPLPVQLGSMKERRDHLPYSGVRGTEPWPMKRFYSRRII